MTDTLSDRLEVFQDACLAGRYAYEGFMSDRQRGALFGRLNKFYKSIGVSGVSRLDRLALISGLLKRKLSSFSDISYGEAKLILSELELNEFLEYVYYVNRLA